VLDDVLLRLKMIVFPTLCGDEEACNWKSGYDWVCGF
jgi:hypothetical protein